MRFKARVLSSQNVISDLIIDAPDRREALAQLEGQSFRVLNIASSSWSFSLGRRQKFSLLLFTQELHALLSAGLGLVEALEGLAEKEVDPELKRIVMGILDALREGKLLSVAMQAQPSVFPELYIGLVHSAEGSGNLLPTLQRYIDYHQRVDLVRNKLISSALYPVILCFIGGLVTVFLVGYVVPRFGVVYQSTGHNLPLLSRALLTWGQFASEHGRLVFGALILTLTLSIFSIWKFVRSGGLLRFLQRRPMFERRYKPFLLSRFYLTLGMLLQGGMPILAALKTAQTVVPTTWESKLRAVQNLVDSGHSLSDSLDRQSLSTPISLRMMRVGEQTGQLGIMLCKAAEFYEGDIARFVDRFMKTFEPLLMAIIGLVIGTIVVLLYMPIFELAGSLQ